MLQTRKLENTSYDWANPESLLDLGLRFFTPTEVARLHAFPMAPWANEYSASKTEKDAALPRQYQPPHCTPYIDFLEITTMYSHITRQ
ncbi:hypothetical protein VKS41_008311 [Umbelopsis sp. WA50703]